LQQTTARRAEEIWPESSAEPAQLDPSARMAGVERLADAIRGFATLFVCAVSVGSAVFLILEMDGPFHGLLKVSAEPWRFAVAHLNR
jgi:hypothetical protein